MYKCKHFEIEELVPPELFVALHEDALWRMFDHDILKAADWLRERYGLGAPFTHNQSTNTKGK